MKILIGCEESQRVCMAFRALGHDAYSCDIQPSSGGHPEYHIQGDILQVIKMNDWDMLIAFPPCTYLSNAGARHLYPKGKLNEKRYAQGMQARKFFMSLYDAPIKYKAIENPTPSRIFKLPTHTQVIQPYEFGEPYTKRTLLWLQNLPPLRPTKIMKNPKPFIWTRSKIGSGSKILSKKERSKTFLGIADAMAKQWSSIEYEQLSLFDIEL